MLNLLHRHIFKEIIVSTAFAMGLFVFVLLVGNMLSDILELVVAGKLDVILFAKLMWLLIPFILPYALPMGMLTGTLMAMGRLSSQNEITAMKSAGVGLFRIAAPVFFISTLGMVAGMVVNLHYAPQSRIAYKQLMASAIRENPVSFIEEKRFINEFPGAVIYTSERDGRVLKDVWLWKLDDERRVEVFARAREGHVAFRQSDLTLALTLIDGQLEIHDTDAPENVSGSMADLNTPSFGELPYEWSLEGFFGEQHSVRVKTKNMTFAQLMATRDQLLAAEAEVGKGMTAARLEVQFHVQQNCALAFSVFSLAIFGVPLAIRVRRKEGYANFGIALVIAMSFYFLLIAVSWLEGQVAVRPDLLIWLPNIIFQSFGLWLLAKANRH